MIGELAIESKLLLLIRFAFDTLISILNLSVLHWFIIANVITDKKTLKNMHRKLLKRFKNMNKQTKLLNLCRTKFNILYYYVIQNLEAICRRL